MSQHFALEEFLISDTADAHDIDNFPTWDDVECLTRLAGTMEKVRRILGNRSIAITSGFRCPDLNAAVGGVPDSAHLDGLACDFVCPEFGTPYEICKALEPFVVVLDIDQLIYEMGWVHLGLSFDDARNQCLTVNNDGTQEGFV